MKTKKLNRVEKNVAHVLSIVRGRNVDDFYKQDTDRQKIMERTVDDAAELVAHVLRFGAREADPKVRPEFDKKLFLQIVSGRFAAF